MIDTLVYPAPYTRDEAMRMGRALDELGFWWFEDPLPKTDLDGLAELTRECKVVQIRAADRVEDISEYAAMIRQRCMDIMAGPASFGITDLMKLAALAEANNMKMEPHDFGGGTASLHVGLAISNCDYYEQATPGRVLRQRDLPWRLPGADPRRPRGVRSRADRPRPRLRHRPEGGREGRLRDPVAAESEKLGYGVGTDA